jgi:hypothetical protein
MKVFICVHLRKNLRKSAGKLSWKREMFKVQKHFPQIFADFFADSADGN